MELIGERIAGIYFHSLERFFRAVKNIKAEQGDTVIAYGRYGYFFSIHSTDNEVEALWCKWLQPEPRKIWETGKNRYTLGDKYVNVIGMLDW